MIKQLTKKQVADIISRMNSDWLVCWSHGDIKYTLEWSHAGYFEIEYTHGTYPYTIVKRTNGCISIDATMHIKYVNAIMPLIVELYSKEII